MKRKFCIAMYLITIIQFLLPLTLYANSCRKVFQSGGTNDNLTQKIGEEFRSYLQSKMDDTHMTKNLGEISGEKMLLLMRGIFTPHEYPITQDDFFRPRVRHTEYVDIHSLSSYLKTIVEKLKSDPTERKKLFSFIGKLEAHEDVDESETIVQEFANIMNIDLSQKEKHYFYIGPGVEFGKALIREISRKKLDLHITFFDISDYVIEVLSHIKTEKDLGKSTIEILQGDLTKYNFQSIKQKPDYLILAQVLHDTHLKGEELKKVLQTFIDFLPPGGILHINDLHHRFASTETIKETYAFFSEKRTGINVTSNVYEELKSEYDRTIHPSVSVTAKKIN